MTFNQFNNLTNEELQLKKKQVMNTIKVLTIKEASDEQRTIEGTATGS